MSVHSFQSVYKLRLDQSTKPFNARGSKVQRCAKCAVALQFCLCQYKVVIGSEARFMVLLSQNEVFKPSNTGRLIGDIFPNSQYFQWQRTQAPQALLDVLNHSDFFPVLIFPDHYAQKSNSMKLAVKNELPRHKKPLFILLDGSWREARRMYHQSPYLHDLPLLSFTPQQISQYQMRKSDNLNHLSTVEVASLCLEWFGEEKQAQCLQHWFAVFRESYLLSRSQGRGNIEREQLRLFSAHYQRHSGRVVSEDG
ncbi:MULTISPECIES: tRNA-uridine aminocarboxypropyltransferase [unclassified Vibrio]|uniref:tRNA-uridine aminocarboxypropyltransferase n=1 Tax=Vibrio sp. HB236076 TaxID=3232307 RepID=A0AB39HAV0_9VIBR|nr:DTW domain-containing protein [Vibrio sp. HB161653]MDP5253418.1 DTW domain-containing protein [Vibrio sp. HB161653]